LKTVFHLFRSEFKVKTMQKRLDEMSSKIVDLIDKVTCYKAFYARNLQMFVIS
jgi:hypothetical protein